jgi:hypothetical protein
LSFLIKFRISEMYFLKIPPKNQKKEVFNQIAREKRAG